MPFTYVASPYSHPNPAIRQARYDAVCHYIYSCDTGSSLFSPIVHWHPIALKHRLPGDWRFWSKINFDMLAAAADLHILQLPGWEDSRGIAAEMGFARGKGLPIAFIAPSEQMLRFVSIVEES